MKVAIGVLFAISMALIGWAKLIDRRSLEVASVSESIVPYAFGAILLVADLVLLAGYALWRLFA